MKAKNEIFLLIEGSNLKTYFIKNVSLLRLLGKKKIGFFKLTEKISCVIFLKLLFLKSRKKSTFSVQCFKLFYLFIIIFFYNFSYFVIFVNKTF